VTDAQVDLFGAPQDGPAGFRYAPDVLSPDEEQALLDRIRELPFREFEFQGYVGRRRVVSFGWRYDFTDQLLHPAGEIPDFLMPAREAATRFAGIAPDDLTQALVTEYSAGAAIGWHRDRSVFGDVIGISLLAACVFRLRRKAGGRWERFSVTAEPRSAYLLHGVARTEWEHSIPPVPALRYSITFRTLRAPTAHALGGPGDVSAT
jgi:alkylated DNA repair dioxygenase AlkB